jgi:formate dehydrogenase iron-sulfur subunit
VSVRVFVPGDAAARSVGAEAVALAFEASGMEVVRTGSRGLLWLEPLVEVEGADGRVGFRNVRAADVAGLVASGFGGGHALSVGRVEDLPWLARQSRLTFARVGVADPLSLAAYRAQGGLAGLAAARAMGPDAIVAAVAASGLRGRGGAGFPTGVKWRTVAGAVAR